MYQEYLKRFPGRKAFVEALNYDGGKEISTGTSKICREVRLCGLMDIAVHLGPNERVYVRALDFTMAGPSFTTTDSQIREAAIARVMRGTKRVTVDLKIKHDITNFLNSIDKLDRNIIISQKILTTYREEIGDPQAQVSETMNRTNSGTLRRTNQKFVTIELLPHLLSRMGFLASPPDPTWLPVWRLIQDMEPLGSCPLMDPRSRTQLKAEDIAPEVKVEENIAPVMKKRIRDRVFRKDIVIPPATDGELATEEEINIPNDRLMQLERSALVRMVRGLKASLEASREKFRVAFIESAEAAELRAGKLENANLRLEKKKLQEQLREFKARALMAEREISDQKRIDEATDLSKVSLSPSAMKTLNSYAALFKSKTPEEIMGWAVRRENILNQSILAMERAKKALHDEIAATASREAIREAERIKAALNKGILIKEFTSQISQTELQLEAILLQNIEDQKEKFLATQDKSRVEHIPALKGKDAEDRLHSVLVQMAPVNATVLVTRGVGHCGDFIVTFNENDLVIGYSLIDCKSYSGPVPVKEVEKLEKDIDYCTELFGCSPRWSAIISVESDITHDGLTGAPDFDHGTTPVFLIHSAHRSGDISSAVREMLCKADYVHKLRPFVPIKGVAVAEIAAFEKKITEKKKGRGRSHSQSKIRVTFDQKSQSRQRSQSKTRTEPDDDQEEVQLGKVMKSSRTGPIGLDPRIFTTTELSQANVNLAYAVTKIYKYDEGKIENSKDVMTAVMRATGLGESFVRHGLKEILLSTIKIGNKIYNLSLN